MSQPSVLSLFADTDDAHHTFCAEAKSILLKASVSPTNISPSPSLPMPFIVSCSILNSATMAKHECYHSLHVSPFLLSALLSWCEGRLFSLFLMSRECLSVTAAYLNSSLLLLHVDIVSKVAVLVPKAIWSTSRKGAIFKNCLSVSAYRTVGQSSIQHHETYSRTFLSPAGTLGLLMCSKDSTPLKDRNLPLPLGTWKGSPPDRCSGFVCL